GGCGGGYRGDGPYVGVGAGSPNLWRRRFLALSPPLLRAVHGLLACDVVEARGRHRLSAVGFQQLPPPLPRTAGGSQARGARGWRAADRFYNNIPRRSVSETRETQITQLNVA